MIHRIIPTLLICLAACPFDDPRPLRQRTEIRTGVQISQDPITVEWNTGADAVWADGEFTVEVKPGPDVLVVVSPHEFLGVREVSSDKGGPMNPVDADLGPPPTTPSSEPETIRFSSSDEEKNTYAVYATECFDKDQTIDVAAYVDDNENGVLDSDEAATPLVKKKIVVTATGLPSSSDQILDDVEEALEGGRAGSRATFWSLVGAQVIRGAAPGFMAPDVLNPVVIADGAPGLATKITICGSAAAALQEDDVLRTDAGATARVLWANQDSDGNTCVVVVGIKDRGSFAPGEETTSGQLGFQSLGPIKNTDWGVVEGDLFTFTFDDGTTEQGTVISVLDDTRMSVDAPQPAQQESGTFEVTEFTPPWDLAIKWVTFRRITDFKLEAIGHAHDNDPRSVPKNTKPLPDGKLVSEDDHEIVITLTITLVSETEVEFTIDVNTTSDLEIELRPALNLDTRDTMFTKPSTNDAALWGRLGDEKVIYNYNPTLFQQVASDWLTISPLILQFPIVTNGSSFPWTLHVEVGPDAFGNMLERLEASPDTPADAKITTDVVSGTVSGAGPLTRVRLIWKGPVPTPDEKTGEFGPPDDPRIDVVLIDREILDGPWQLSTIKRWNDEIVGYRLEIDQAGSPNFLVDELVLGGDSGFHLDLSPNKGAVEVCVESTEGERIAGATIAVYEGDFFFGIVGRRDHTGTSDVAGKDHFELEPGTYSFLVRADGYFPLVAFGTIDEGGTVELKAQLTPTLRTPLNREFQLDPRIEIAALNDQTKGDPLEGYVSVDYARSGASPDSRISREQRALTAAPLNILIVAEENGVSGNWDETIKELGLTGKLRIIPGTELASPAAGRCVGFPVAFDETAANGGAPQTTGLDPGDAVAKLKEQASFVFLPNLRRVEEAPLGNGMLETPHGEEFPKRLPGPLNAKGVQIIRDLGADGVEILANDLRAWRRDDVFAMFNQGYFPTIFGGSAARNHDQSIADVVAVTRTYVYWPEFPDTGSKSLAEALAEKLKAGDVYVTSGPRVICLYDADQDGTPETRMGSMVHDPDGKGDLHIIVLAENYDPVDKVSLWQGGKEFELSGVEPNPDELSTSSTTLVRYKEVVPVEFTGDTWFSVEVIGFADFTSFRWKTTGSMFSIAYTNPIRVDKDGDGKVEID